MRTSIGALVLVVSVGCMAPTRQPLFAACVRDDDCDHHRPCLPGVARTFCSEPCDTLADCELVREGVRVADVCGQPPQGPRACFMACPSPGVGEEDGCETIGLPARVVADPAGADVCVCAP